MDWNLNNHWYGLLGLLVVTWSLLAWYVSHSPWAVQDQAVDRSLHQGQVQTGGGLLMFLPWLFFLLLFVPDLWVLWVVGAMVVLGWVDDRKHLSFQLRLLVQALAAWVSLWYLGFDPVTPLALFLLLSMIWWINLFNFMDGANGMAGLHAVVTLSFYAWCSMSGQGMVLNTHWLALAGVAVLLPYLWFNLIQKRLFMGDSGSLPLALLQGLVALALIQAGTLSMPQVAVIHALFIIDATYTLIKRLASGENITEAHASHLYQKLVKSGWSHARVSWLYAAITALLCVMTVTVLDTVWLVLLAYVLLFGLYLRMQRQYSDQSLASLKAPK